jgi:hypothetical protein
VCEIITVFLGVISIFRCLLEPLQVNREHGQQINGAQEESPAPSSITRLQGQRNTFSCATNTLLQAALSEGL